jgi:hypothetical protein
MDDKKPKLEDPEHMRSLKWFIGGISIDKPCSRCCIVKETIKVKANDGEGDVCSDCINEAFTMNPFKVTK